MDLDDIKQILELMREHELVELELERDNVKLRLRKQAPGDWAGGLSAMPQVTISTSPQAPASSAAVPAAAAAPADAPVLTAADDALDFAIVKSPIVGTFYRSAEPGAKPFADVGQVVKKGDVLCIIEAMKLMNEINAECDGEIVKVYVENGQAVQYGERLFAIKPQ